jgi:hypothetical protein
MTTGTTTLLGLALPVDGELDGTWGDVVNYGITNYVDISVAGTLTLNGDGAVTLANTTGTASGTNITSTTAQYAIIRITGTLTTTKIVTAPSYSKTYIVDNAATGGSVTFKASGQTGVSVPVGEKVTVYYNGTDYVKISGGTVNLATQVTGVLPAANGGTGLSSAGTAGNVLTSTGSAWVSSAPATGLPSQTGNAGKYLTTNGSSASWTETGAAAGGSIYVNNTLISSNYTIASGQNGFSVGPITQAPGVTVTITAGQRWVVL